ncbi:MAG: ABC transporter ATP-binding protein [Planctomycetes bacterium]|jgi:ABC-type dipeptide/oligopeptide/nickel transport system ATPase component|nr:ABC transporter ATP-binding protein [Planctomycetota bacterium]MCP4838998.1 ABC transporter ATP-binding protein [Planctomycetota bacterium]
MTSAVLEVVDLEIRLRAGPVLVEKLSLSISAGSMTALVGESGSGKTLSAMAIMGLLPPGINRSGGSIHVCGDDVSNGLGAFLGRDVTMVFQEPMTSLDPVMRIDRQLLEARRRRVRCRGRRGRAWCVGALSEVGIDDAERVAAAFPHELSGGMRQRVLIAMGLAPEPRLILADEPTTALDAINRRDALELLASATRKGAGVLLITHDLGSVRGWADHIVVMRGGRCCEQGPTLQVLENPKHPYTKGLLECVPQRGHRGPLPELPAGG